MRIRRTSGFLASLAACCVCAFAHAQEEPDTGDLTLLEAPDDYDVVAMRVVAISADAKVLVGSATDSETRRDIALRWTTSGDVKLLRQLDPAEPMLPVALSGDGSVILGSRKFGSAGVAMWIGGGAPVEPELEEGVKPLKGAVGMDAGATRIVGSTDGKLSEYVYTIDITPDPKWFRVMSSEKPRYVMGLKGITSDAEVVYGGSFAGGPRDAWWDSEGKYNTLPVDGARVELVLSAALIDARVFVANRFTNDRNALPSVVMWFEGDEEPSEPTVIHDGASSTRSYTVEGAAMNGAVVWGRWFERADTPVGESIGTWIWTERTGVMDADDAFDALGIDRGGYTISRIDAISADGYTVAGRCRATEGFLPVKRAFMVHDD